MKYELRELGIGEILDQSIQILKNKMGLLLAIGSVFYLPGLLLSSAIHFAVMPTPPADPTPESVAAYQQEVLAALPLMLPVVLLLMLVIVPITWGAVIHAISKEYLEESVSVGESLRVGISRAMPLIGSMILVYLSVMGGTFLCVVPGILFAFWLYLVAPIVIVERTAGVAALKRSRELTRGQVGKIFVLGLLLLVIQVPVGMVTGLIPVVAVRIVANAVLQIIFFCFATAASVVLYFSSRCAHEDFDLVRLAEAVGSAPPKFAESSPGPGGI